MKFFIDTANIKEIETAHQLGILDGVTTNPTLLSREKGDYREILKQICKIVDGPISAEVISDDSEGMIKEAEKLREIGDNIVIKIPCTKQGLIAVNKLRNEEILCNVTLIFSPVQALMSARAGAAFVSPFVGRLDDIQHDGMNLIQDIMTIYDNYCMDTEIIVASIRHPIHVVQAALIGADICTIPFSVIDKLLNHPLTNNGIANFKADWEKVSK
ncbi:MAG: fructose-6-phosphate aldolase [Candidatus Coatesbacteria bacterium]|nr:fructose-6-phosphate aldolase [Candidatus Coatesbacteria bacterium]